MREHLTKEQLEALKVLNAEQILFDLDGIAYHLKEFTDKLVSNKTHEEGEINAIYLFLNTLQSHTKTLHTYFNHLGEV